MSGQKSREGARIVLYYFRGDMSIESEVMDIVAEQLGLERAVVTVDKSFVALGADSLDLTELIMTFEEKFNLEISEDEAEKLKTVGDVARYLEARKA